MKKLISILLIIIMIFTVTTPAFAYQDMFATRSQIPVICVSGDGGKLENENGEKISTLTSFITGADKEDDNKSNIINSVSNILVPLIAEGIISDKWDNYYQAIQDEVSDLFKEMILDKDGNPQYGTTIEKWAKDQNEYDVTYDRRGDKGYYDQGDYQFWYDWRLDPIYNADRLYEYIQGVKRATGRNEISLVGRCVGSNVVMAYIQKYGLDGIHGVGFDGAVCNGSEVLTDVFSGEFTVDANAINRFVTDLNGLGMFELAEIITTTLDMLDKTGLLDNVKDAAKEKFYDKLGQGVISAVVLATFSMPCYWGAVSYDKFDVALDYVFGKEGSKKRTEYAGLIEKLSTYNETVKQNVIPLLKGIGEAGKKVCIVSKYGIQMVPMGKNCNTQVADQITSVKSSSFGATTSDIYNKLDEKYIAKQAGLGLDKYISPDKIIDASTCIYPDYTWFVKGVSHSNWTYAENMLVTTVVTADRQLTVDDFAETQFTIFPTDYWNPLRAMTTENCNTEFWSDESLIQKDDTNMFSKLYYMVRSVLKFFKMIFNLIFKNGNAEVV